MPASGEVTALVLSGGAAYAAYEVGVLRALLAGESPSTGYRPVQPQVISGTSAGAFNGAVFVSALERDPVAAAEHLADVWLHQVADAGDDCGNGIFRFRTNPFDAFNVFCPRTTLPQQLARLEDDTAFLATDFVARTAGFLRMDVSLQQRVMELVDISTVVSTDPFAEVIRRNVRLDRIRSSPVRLLIATTNWKTGKLRMFQGTEMTDEIGYDVIRASAAVPGIFNSVEVGGEPHVDGGVVMNTPLKGAIDCGADTVHIVYVNPDVVQLALPRVRNAVNSMFRALVIVWASLANNDIEVARNVNLGLRLLQPAERAEHPAELKALIRQVSGLARHLEDDPVPYRFITIHRYSPREMVGGLYRWLSFEREQVLELMRHGYADARSHDCSVNGCVLPDEGPLA
jgi:predicted acylesterase/phospholipase RssA